MNDSTLIITGGDVNVEFAKEYCKKNSFSLVIAADGGLRTADLIGIIPDYVVGDFDTISPLALFKYENIKDVKIKRYKPEKDFTDTQVAMMTAIEEGSFSIHILGGTGTRIDHTLANIQLLQIALSNGMEAMIVNEYNRIRLLGDKRKNILLNKSEYKYVSLIPLSSNVLCVTTKGMKYELNKHNFAIDKEISLGVSNEIVSEEAEISISSGTMILIESVD